MLIDARKLDASSDPELDVCVIGAGAAGITLARSLATAPLSIGLLESGGFSPEPEVRKLYRGQCSGEARAANDGYMQVSRQRFFGGTTNHWTGWTRPLDGIDFEKRSWVAHSGWPIHRDELEGYYLGAADILDIEPFGPADETPGFEGEDRPGGSIVTKRYHISGPEPTRVGRKYRRQIEESERITLFLHANAVDFDMADERVTAVRVATLTGKRFSVKAKAFVLATGGIENARLLLNARGARPDGLGNEHGLVGRFFMEHPHVGGTGNLVLTDLPPSVRPYRSKWNAEGAGQVFSVLCLDEDALRRHRLLNAGFQLRGLVLETSDPFQAAAGEALFGVDRLRRGRASASSASGEAPFHDGELYVRAEQVPSPASRITLLDERCALGLRRVKLEWRLSHQDRESLERTVEIMGRELGRLARGRCQLTLDPEAPWKETTGGYHHLGTTRMSESPKEGVVDRNAKVHSAANLYVAGSSVFPTGGFANPTYTLVALALRLGDHLKKELGHG